MTLRKKCFANIVGNGANAGNQHFLLFPQCFLSSSMFSILSKTNFCFEVIFIMLSNSLQLLSIWNDLKFCRFCLAANVTEIRHEHFLLFPQCFQHFVPFQN